MTLKKVKVIQLRRKRYYKIDSLHLPHCVTLCQILWSRSLTLGNIQKMVGYLMILNDIINYKEIKIWKDTSYNLMLFETAIISMWHQGRVYCAFSDRYRDAGIIVIAVFCGGLVAGRILSVIVDGIPSPILILYIFMELSLVPVCIWLMRRDN